MEKEIALHPALDARLMLEHVPVSRHGQGLARPCRTSPMLMGNAEIDVAASALRMRGHQYLLRPSAALQLKRSAESGLDERGTSVALIERLAAAAEMRDHETGGHLVRTGIYAGMIAKGLGLPEEYAEMIALAATVHDFGKIGIQDSILTKPAPLTSQEFETMKTHTVLGEQILSGSSCPLLQLAASIALSHHERWDGSGYPYGLAGQRIPLASRIVMLADQYDALRSRRVYKGSLDHATTCAILCHGDAVTRPEHFDPRILRAFLALEPQLAKACEELAARGEAPGGRAAALIPPCAGTRGKGSVLPVSGHC